MLAMAAHVRFADRFVQVSVKRWWVPVLILDESDILGPPAFRDPSPKVFTIAQICVHKEVTMLLSKTLFAVECIWIRTKDKSRYLCWKASGKTWLMPT